MFLFSRFASGPHSYSWSTNQWWSTRAHRGDGGDEPLPKVCDQPRRRMLEVGRWAMGQGPQGLHPDRVDQQVPQFLFLESRGMAKREEHVRHNGISMSSFQRFSVIQDAECSGWLRIPWSYSWRRNDYQSVWGRYRSSVAWETQGWRSKTDESVYQVRDH